MMPIGGFKLLHGHSEKAGSVAKINTLLHQPRRTGMTQNMWRHIDTKPSGFHRSRKPLTHAIDRHTVPLDYGFARKSEPVPAAQMGKQARW